MPVTTPNQIHTLFQQAFNEGSADDLLKAHGHVAKLAKQDKRIAQLEAQVGRHSRGELNQLNRAVKAERGAKFLEEPLADIIRDAARFRFYEQHRGRFSTSVTSSGEVWTVYYKDWKPKQPPLAFEESFNLWALDISQI